MSAVRTTPPADGPRGEPLRSRVTRLIQHQVGRFATVGVVNTLVDLGAFVVLTYLGLGVLAANTISTSLGMAVSFFGNRRFVFGRTNRPIREVVLFFAVAAFGVWVIQPLVIVAVLRILSSISFGAEPLALPIGKVVAIVVAAVWNFVLYKHLVFRKHRTVEIQAVAGIELL